MGRTEYTNMSRTGFLVDPSSAERSSGRQIDWDEVDEEDFGVVGARVIPHGHPMAPSGGDSNKIVPATNAAANEAAAIGLLEGPAAENDQSAALSGYGLITGGVAFAELVPGMTATTQSALEGNARGFLFEEYADSRADES